jgi:DNA-binding XRE family transcriptional regulator
MNAPNTSNRSAENHEDLIAHCLVKGGRIRLDNTALRQLRHARLMSQQDLADDCWRRKIRVSLPTIKRAESGHAVRFRSARELARCFDVPIARIIRKSAA